MEKVELKILYLIGDVLQKAMPVSKSFSGQADPLAGCCARQAHIVFLLVTVR